MSKKFEVLVEHLPTLDGKRVEYVITSKLRQGMGYRVVNVERCATKEEADLITDREHGRLRRGAYHPPDAGFTLIELLCGIVMLGCLALLAAPSVREFTRHQRIEGEAVSIVSACRLAQARAVATLGWHEVRFSVPRNEYSVWRIDWVAGVRGETLVSKPRKIDPRVKLANASFFGMPSVTFYPDGGASGTGTAVLTDGRSTYRIGVLAGTGKSTVTAVR